MGKLSHRMEREPAQSHSVSMGSVRVREDFLEEGHLDHVTKDKQKSKMERREKVLGAKKTNSLGKGKELDLI